jgi:hypothetical protein
MISGTTVGDGDNSPGVTCPSTTMLTGGDIVELVHAPDRRSFMKAAATILSVLLTTVILSLASDQPRVPRREIENVACFARLYGVIRYFYPSDTAAALDWNSFAIYGIHQVRTARDPAELASRLEELVRPLGPGIVIGTHLPPPPERDTGAPLVAWRYLGPPALLAPAFQAKRTHRPKVAIDGFVALEQAVPAQNLRGRTIRLRGRVRAVAQDESGVAALALLVDGSQNMIRATRCHISDWQPRALEAVVPERANTVIMRILASGEVTADFDAIDLAVRHSSGEWTPIPIRDAGFESPQDAEAGAWTRAGPGKHAVITRLAEGAPQGRQFLRIAPSPDAASKTELFEEDPPAPGDHVDLDLGLGIQARVPLALTDSEARPQPRDSQALVALQKALRATNMAEDRQDIALSLDARLADIVVAWNVFRHFYPYWPQVGVDWDSRLEPQLTAMYPAETRPQQQAALRLLTADARDGHSDVVDPAVEAWVCPVCALRREGRGYLPLQLGLIGDTVTVTASAYPAAPVGSVISAMDGTRAKIRLQAAERFISGSPQWKTARALQEMATCTERTVVQAIVDTGAGPHRIELPCEEQGPVPEKRPDQIAELKPGLWYVDLTRAREAAVKPMLPKLAEASAIIFDVRGYPTDAYVVPNLISTPWGSNGGGRGIARIVGPFGKFAGWREDSGPILPAPPRLPDRIVFLTDARAISSGEGLLSTVSDRHLGKIVGSPTAGANGNELHFLLPGGFEVSMTGSRLTRAGGRTYHLIGIQPDVRAVPTVAGLRAGRDEVLERAISLLQENARHSTQMPR